MEEIMEEQEDTFPYKRYESITEKPQTYFRRAQTYNSRRVEERLIYTPIQEERLLNKDAVLSRSPGRAFFNHFPLDFKPSTASRRDKRTKVALIIPDLPSNYNSINLITDYYTEDARVRDRGAYMKISPYEFWNTHRERILFEAGESRHEQRELLWRTGPKEARQAKITDYLTLFSILGSRVVLDASAAWGDRLIAALASPKVVAYTGVDPHSRLPRGWQEILDDFCPISGKKDCEERFVMINEPFEPHEDQTPLPEGMGNYDTVLVSTAPLFGDQYDAGNPNQAVARHGSSFRSYVRGFLIPYLQRCIEALSDEGYICITVLDRARDQYYITELNLLLVELLAGHVMHYQGVIWWQLRSQGLVPWWIFMKKAVPISRERLQEARRLYQPYIEMLGDLRL